MSTHNISLSLSSGKVHVNPDSIKVDYEDQVVWLTTNDSTTFEIVVHNHDKVFNDVNNVIKGEVTKEQSFSKFLNPKPSVDINNTKYYSVGITSGVSQIDAPPRIIIVETQ